MLSVRGGEPGRVVDQGRSLTMQMITGTATVTVTPNTGVVYALDADDDDFRDDDGDCDSHGDNAIANTSIRSSFSSDTGSAIDKDTCSYMRMFTRGLDDDIQIADVGWCLTLPVLTLAYVVRTLGSRDIR